MARSVVMASSALSARSVAAAMAVARGGVFPVFVHVLGVVGRADHARVRRRAALPFELFHLDDDFVDGRLQELERRRREVRQVAFGRGACEIQFGRGAAGGFENAPGDP